ncbi:MAG: UDP-4-amino-4,6-dideoxy-N-acetyl-beta-L-altrosamine transaminase [Thalassospira sp.]|uniref:UDP-4-amino-4, 6-dideoxy-N-acetyl-beta-L-altrosamine transaminase n=1 Tax=Thalassospira sp. TaxID=1912094 RepID=UPI0032ECA304
MSQKRLNYGRHSVHEAEIQAVVRVLTSDFLTQGPMVEKFEQEVCRLTGAKHAVAFSSGTAALHGAAWAAGVSAGDVGVTQAITFCASANMFRYCGANVAFTDIDDDTLNMCPDSLEETLSSVENLGSIVKVVVPVHMAGVSCRADEIRKVASKQIVIEDASHSFGATYEDGQMIGCGAYSDITVFSFHPVKPITTGEGGIAVTNDSEFASRLRLMRSHGIERSAGLFLNPIEDQGGDLPGSWYYEQQCLGYNYRMSDIHAALGLAQLDRLTSFAKKRKDLALAYDVAFEAHPFVKPLQALKDLRVRSANHLYAIMVDFDQIGMDRVAVMENLKGKGIWTQVHYIPVYRHPYYKQLYPNLQMTDFSRSERYYSHALTLPLFPEMDNKDVCRVVDALSALGKV